MAISWALRKGCMEQREAREQIAILRDLPSLLDDILPEMRVRAQELAVKYATCKNFFYLGRGFPGPWHWKAP